MRTRHLALSLCLFVSLTTQGCAFMQDDDGDYHGERSDPPDLTVRQSPSSTVRLGDTVTFTAVFRDSLNPKWLYDWALNDNGAVPVGGHERTIRWVPPTSGTFLGNLWVYNASVSSRATIYYRKYNYTLIEGGFHLRR